MKASKEVMKKTNEKLLLKEIYFNKGIDRATLAKKSNLSPATVTNLVGEMVEKNLVKETGMANSTGGRKPISLEVNPSFKKVLALKIGLGYLDFLLTDLNGTILQHSKIYYENKMSPNLVIGELEKIWNLWNLNSTELLGIGVAVSGVIDSKNGIIKNSFLLKWENIKLAKILNDKFSVYIFISNDVDSFALAQLWKGEAWKYPNSMFLTLGVGIGGAIILNGKLHSSNGGVGEFGHMTVKLDGRKCNCGSKGCLEAEASFEVLAEKVFEKTDSVKLKSLYESLNTTESSEMEFLQEAITHDKKTLTEVFNEYSKIIGIALKNIINIFAPDYLLLGGEALQFKEYFFNTSINYAKENAFIGLADNLVFDEDKLGDKAWTYGCIYQIIVNELLTVK